MLGIASSSSSSLYMLLVRTLERWYSLALVLVKGSTDNLPVAQLGLAVWLLLPRQGVLHPLLVVTVGEVLTCVRSS
jgi:uncharacterized membrane protein